MMDRILVPLDGSEKFTETLAYVVELGKGVAPEVLLLHVQAPAAAAEDHPVLKNYVDALEARQWRVQAVVRTGDPVAEIVRFAVETGPALIVMSTHGRSGLERIRAGSVTEQVLRQSPCPVFILHSTRPDTTADRHDHLFRRMLVPLDGSEVSAAILPCVEKFARHFNTEVILFHDHPECDAAADAGRRREFLDQHGVTLANAGIPVQLDCSTHRRPAQEILSRIDALDIDIVAMVSHGKGGVHRALDESVTANVMRHANRPLLVWSSDPQCPRIG